MFSANKNIALEELSKVASGGEMSRLMISIKSLIVETIILPTIIFDEIDIAWHLIVLPHRVTFHILGY